MAVCVMVTVSLSETLVAVGLEYEWGYVWWKEGEDDIQLIRSFFYTHPPHHPSKQEKESN